MVDQFKVLYMLCVLEGIAMIKPPEWELSDSEVKGLCDTGYFVYDGVYLRRTWQGGAAWSLVTRVFDALMQGAVLNLLERMRLTKD